jgi:hypothetical protein
MDVGGAFGGVSVEIGRCQVWTIIVGRVEGRRGIIPLNKVLTHGDSLNALNHRAAVLIRPPRPFPIIQGEHEARIHRVQSKVATSTVIIGIDEYRKGTTKGDVQQHRFVFVPK